MIAEATIVPTGYQQTEVGVIPDDWQVELLDEVAIRGSGHTPNKQKPEYWNGDVRWISLQDTNKLDQRYIFETAATITPAGIANSSAVMHTPGTVVLSRDAGVGKSAIMASAMAVSQHFIAWRCGPDLNNEFLYYWLQATKREFERIAMGSTIKTIGLPYFRELKVPVPPLAEQEAIAEALGDTDALIESVEQLVAKKRHLKQAAMQQLLTGKKRLPGFEGEWRLRPIGEIAPLQRGFDLPNARLKRGPYPVVYSNGVLNHHAEYQVDGPGVVTGRSGTIGNVTFVDGKFWPHNTALWVTSFKGNHEKFIFYLFTTLSLEQFATGSGVPTLNRNDVHEYKVRIPHSRDEQIAIAQVLTDMDAEIEAIEAKLAKARQIKQGMMQVLLTGQVRLVTVES